MAIGLPVIPLKVKMSQSVPVVNGKSSVLIGSDRILLARNWVPGDETRQEPYLSAAEVRLLVLEARGRGIAIETLLSMAERGEVPAYRDTSRKTRWGAHPILFRWSEVRPVLVGRGRCHSQSSKIVRIVPQKGKR